MTPNEAARAQPTILRRTAGVPVTRASFEAPDAPLIVQPQTRQARLERPLAPTTDAEEQAHSARITVVRPVARPGTYAFATEKPAQNDTTAPVRERIVLESPAPSVPRTRAVRRNNIAQSAPRHAHAPVTRNTYAPLSRSASVQPERLSERALIGVYR